MPTPTTSVSDVYNTDKNHSTDDSCPRCGARDFFTEERGPHLGKFCRGCGKWMRWLPQGHPIEIMPFGRYSGSAIKNLPDDYLNWLLENVALKGSLLKALSQEFERRGDTAP
jgi:hypothetical protein